MSQYLLKPGALLQTFGDPSKTVTNANLTDELAKWYLETQPSCVNKFSRIPGKELTAVPLSRVPNELEIVPVPDEKTSEPEKVVIKKKETVVSKNGLKYTPANKHK